MANIKQKVFHVAERLVQIVEVILALGLMMSVIGGMVAGSKHLWDIVTMGDGQSFQLLIDQSLLYIIGLEIAMMLIKRDPNIVLDILIFAIARKMIVDTSGGLEFLLGSVAILILYFVRHYDFRRHIHFRSRGVQKEAPHDTNVNHVPPEEYSENRSV